MEFKEKILIGTVGKEEKEVWIEGQALETYNRMTEKEQDKFTTEMLHNIFYRLFEEGVVT